MNQINSVITQIQGRAVVVRGDDIDTDRIIPARYLRTVTFETLSGNVFEDDRVGGGHPFDDERFKGASILIANRNFGCGSSREHAPQALMRWGITGFLAESFAEIFFGNCVALGLPCFTASNGDITQLMDAVEADPSQTLNFDIGAQQVTYNGGSLEASIPDGPRSQFLDGAWDAIGQLLEVPERIKETAARLPYTTNFA